MCFLVQNAFAARAPPWTPLGELTALARPLAELKGPISKGRMEHGRGREIKRVGGKGWRGRERVIAVLVFPHFEPCTAVKCYVFSCRLEPVKLLL